MLEKTLNRNAAIVCNLITLIYYFITLPGFDDVMGFSWNIISISFLVYGILCIKTKYAKGIVILAGYQMINLIYTVAWLVYLSAPSIRESYLRQCELKQQQISDCNSHSSSLVILHIVLTVVFTIFAIITSNYALQIRKDPAFYPTAENTIVEQDCIAQNRDRRLGSVDTLPIYRPKEDSNDLPPVYDLEMQSVIITQDNDAGTEYSVNYSSLSRHNQMSPYHVSDANI